eukprot:6849614-Pyramimonas_sp.AAC.1
MRIYPRCLRPIGLIYENIPSHASPLARPRPLYEQHRCWRYVLGLNASAGYTFVTRPGANRVRGLHIRNTPWG